MEGGEDVHNNNEDIDDFYVVDSWSEKSSRPDIKFNSVGNNILSGKDKLSCRKPTEDEKGSQCTNGPCKSTIMESSSRHLGGRSRSPYTNSASRHHPVRENMRFPPREGGRNHSHIDSLRNDKNCFQDKRHYEGIRRNRRSRSRSRERKNYRRRSYERRSSLSLSPPPKRESGNQSSMEPRSMPSYYQSSGAPIPPDPSFMNPNPNPNFGFSTSGPVQYPINPASSNTSYGRYPGYNVPANNLFNSDPTQPQSFQPQMPQNFPQNQYPNPPQNYNLYNPVMQSNPPNPVSYPATWNQSSTGFNQNYSVPTLSSTDAVMYPHLKIGQSRVDRFKNSHRETLNSSSPLRQSRSSLEKRMHSTSRSPEPRKHKRKASKRYSRSPSLDRKFDDNNKRYARHSKSPVKSFRYDSKNPKVIIDPSRIPTPPPPPIVGSYKNNNSIKSIELRAKNVDRRSDVNPLSDFLNKENVSLSCLLEAVMETSGYFINSRSDGLHVNS
ncbi:unnamed protein product [Nezara viridula]|uniref:Uncharacterized protein n=1 Tax=Nezara viridula TaxID=85310 RepID=A0A9P0EAA2_NEZVI|nr:unnamed protein product [Nezara viridula]